MDILIEMNNISNNLYNNDSENNISNDISNNELENSHNNDSENDNINEINEDNIETINRYSLNNDNIMNYYKSYNPLIVMYKNTSKSTKLSDILFFHYFNYFIMIFINLPIIINAIKFENFQPLNIWFIIVYVYHIIVIAIIIPSSNVWLNKEHNEKYVNFTYFNCLLYSLLSSISGFILIFGFYVYFIDIWYIKYCIFMSVINFFSFIFLCICSIYSYYY